MSIEEQLPELVPFLEDPKAEVRQMAVNALAEYSISPEAQAVLRGTEVVEKLKRCLGDIAAVQQAALATYVNLAADELINRQMASADLTSSIVNLIRGDETTLQEKELCIRVLQNLTRSEDGALSLLQCGKGELQFSDAVRLLKFLFDAPDTPKYHPLYRIAQVLQNCTQVPAGRQFLIDKQRNLVKEILLPLCKHNHPMVQSGMTGALKNALDDDAQHMWLLEEIQVLPMLIKCLRPHLERLERQTAAEATREGNGETEEEAEEREAREKAEKPEEIGGERYEASHLLHLTECFHYLGTSESGKEYIQTNQGELFPILRDTQSQLTRLHERSPAETETLEIASGVCGWLPLVPDRDALEPPKPFDANKELDQAAAADAEDID